MSQYDFSAFLLRIENLGLIEVLAEANAECGRTENASFGVRGAPKKRAEGSVAYVTQLKQFLFFLQTGTRPGGVNAPDFRLYEPVVRALVARSHLDQVFLKPFEQNVPP